MKITATASLLSVPFCALTVVERKVIWPVKTCAIGSLSGQEEERN